MPTASPASPHATHDSTRDNDLETAARKLLQTTGYTALRKVRCEVADAVVTMRGRLPSYYLKQMAQSVLRRLHGVRTVLNLIEVVDERWT